MSTPRTIRKGAQPRAEVSTQLPGDEDPKLEQVELPVVPLDTQDKTATVWMTLGLRLNLGRYESAKIDVGMSLPCKPDDVDAVYERVKSWCSDRLQVEVGKIRSGVQMSEPSSTDGAAQNEQTTE